MLNLIDLTMNALGRLYEMNIDLIYKIEISFSVNKV